MDISKKTTGFEGFEAPVEDDAAATVELRGMGKNYRFPRLQSFARVNFPH